MNSTMNLASGGQNAVSSVSSALNMNISSAESLFSSQLASALSTLSSSTLTSALMSDSQYFEDSISPTTIRQYLTATSSGGDPSNPQNIPNLLRGMKWLLASMSKGRNVSDFFPHVVKLVSVQNLEIRKMVYTYLVHYANYDSNCRELALLSINAFQRGLTDGDSAWIRASALRVLTSIQVSDVLQIQILGVKKCIHDPSPYVRKCAANALCKLYPRIPVHMDDMRRELVEECWFQLVKNEASVMVLSSCMIVFAELCPDRLDLLHPVYRKICHLLADIDEWGQIVTLEILTRYCRKFFRKPTAFGRAEYIDSQRKIRRSVGMDSVPPVETTNNMSHVKQPSRTESSTAHNHRRPPSSSSAPSKAKRRVVKKGFYSDEEDVSTEEDVYIAPNTGRPHKSLASAMRQEHLLGLPLEPKSTDSAFISGEILAMEEDEDDHASLDVDHKMLLQCSLPLLKSRNAGVVLAVCSLQYYCGVASIRIRSAIGKSLVRIYHDRREIQFIVLRSIKTLVYECPSAFTPFLGDFFVKAMDPSFTRLIKLDILTALALEPKAIQAVLNELRTYISHEDKAFVCASIQAVGRTVEISRIVYGREGERSGGDLSSIRKARRESNDIALNCLHGLVTLTECSENAVVVQECVVVIQLVLSLLFSSGLVQSNIVGENISDTIEDPNNIQIMALRKLALLAIRSLTHILEKSGEDSSESEGRLQGDKEYLYLKDRTIILPTKAIAPAIWVISEWLTKSRPLTLTMASSRDQRISLLCELLRLLAATFIDLDPCLKVHTIHFASKTFVQYRKLNSSDITMLCEYILSLGRVDSSPDVRDRARSESNLLHMCLGLTYDTETLGSPCTNVGQESIPLSLAELMLLGNKPAPSWLSIDAHGEELPHVFRFGTLSNMVSHKAGPMYIQLPPWAETDSPSSLRDPPQPAKIHEAQVNKLLGHRVRQETPYSSSESDESSSDGSSEDESSSEDAISSDESTESSYTSSNSDASSTSDDDDDDDDDDRSTDITMNPNQKRSNHKPSISIDVALLTDVNTVGESSANPLELGLRQSDSFSTREDSSAFVLNSSERTVAKKTSLVEEFDGLVMPPLVQQSSVIDINSALHGSAWVPLLRYELTGGLSVLLRTVRGENRGRIIKSSGFNEENRAIICFDLKLENKRSDDGLIRRIRLGLRSSGTVVNNPVKQVILPQELPVLKPGEMSIVSIIVEYFAVSTKEGALSVKLELKSDRGSFPLEIRPPLGELMTPLRMSEIDFESACKRFHSVHHKSEAVLSTVSFSREVSKGIPNKILTVANMYFVNESSYMLDMKSIKMASQNSENTSQILLSADIDVKGTIRVTLCSEDTMLLNSLMSLFKRALLSPVE